MVETALALSLTASRRKSDDPEKQALKRKMKSVNFVPAVKDLNANFARPDAAYNLVTRSNLYHQCFENAVLDSTVLQAEDFSYQFRKRFEFLGGLVRSNFGFLVADVVLRMVNEKTGEWT